MNTQPTYNRAPDLLLHKVAEANGVLAKQNKATESYKFWAGVVDTMKFAWSAMQEVAWVWRQNDMLTAENRFLKDRNRELEKRLNQYETIRSAKLDGTFSEIVERVDMHMKDDRS